MGPGWACGRPGETVQPDCGGRPVPTTADAPSATDAAPRSRHHPRLLSGGIRLRRGRVLTDPGGYEVSVGPQDHAEQCSQIHRIDEISTHERPPAKGAKHARRSERKQQIDGEDANRQQHQDGEEVDGGHVALADPPRRRRGLGTRSGQGDAVSQMDGQEPHADDREQTGQHDGAGHGVVDRSRFVADIAGEGPHHCRGTDDRGEQRYVGNRKEIDGLRASSRRVRIGAIGDDDDDEGPDEGRDPDEDRHVGQQADGGSETEARSLLDTWMVELPPRTSGAPVVYDTAVSTPCIGPTPLATPVAARLAA